MTRVLNGLAGLIVACTVAMGGMDAWAGGNGPAPVADPELTAVVPEPAAASEPRPGAAPAPSPSQAHTDSASNRLERLLESTGTLRADFEQEVHDASGRLLERAAGRMEISRPGRFRWAYEQPYEQLLITDGELVWMYDADLEQVSISRVEQSIAGSPAMLLGGGRLTDGFRVVEAWQREGLEWLAMVPLQEDSDFRRIVLAHDGAVVRRMELTDALAQVTAVVFGDVERDVLLSDERFSFTAPEGVDIIGPDGR